MHDFLDDEKNKQRDRDALSRMVAEYNSQRFALAAELERVKAERDEARQRHDALTEEVMQRTSDVEQLEQRATAAEARERALVSERDELGKAYDTVSRELEAERIAAKRYWVALKEITKPGRGLELTDSAEEQAEYWARETEWCRRTARAALTPPAAEGTTPDADPRNDDGEPTPIARNGACEHCGGPRSEWHSETCCEVPAAEGTTETEALRDADHLIRFAASQALEGVVSDFREKARGWVRKHGNWQTQPPAAEERERTCGEFGHQIF